MRGATLAHAGERTLRERPGPHEPLDRQARLDHRAAAIAAADHHLVRLLPLQVAHGGQPLDDDRPSLEAIHAGELARLVVQPSVLVQDVDERQVVAAPHLVVVEVMGRRDLHGPGAELALHVLVGDDRQAPAEERQDRLAADQRPVAIVVGVHRHRRVAEDRLGARGGHGDPGFGIGRAVGQGEVVANVPQRPGLFVLDVLQVADGGATAGAPVDERLAPVGQVRVPQTLEGDPHRPRAAGIHGEALPRPVGAGTKAAHLAADDAARLVHEPPHPLQVALATQRRARLPLLADDLVQHELRGDAGVIDARHPQRVVAAHAVVADQQVLEGHEDRMAVVQGARDVGRRHGDHEALRSTRGLCCG